LRILSQRSDIFFVGSAVLESLELILRPINL